MTSCRKVLSVDIVKDHSNYYFYLLVFLIGSTISVVVCSSNFEDKVSYLPGYGVVSNMQYSGYIQVDNTTDSNMFYWFVEGNKTVNQFPLGITVWLNGGPGCSSLIGFFEEIGPYTVQRDEQNEEFPYILVNNPNSWTQHTSLLFIDQPVGTGYSFTSEDGFAKNEADVAENMYSVLCQFFDDIHPEYLPSETNPLFIAGESYAGKYIPSISKRILEGGDYLNAAGELTSCSNLFLAGIAIGDGLVDPYSQRTAYPAEAFGFSLIGSYQKLQAEEIATKCQRSLQLGNTKYDDNPCNDINHFIKHAAGEFTSYDVRLWEPVYDKALLEEYLNNDQVKNSLHVAEYEGVYSTCNDTVFDKMKDDVFISTKKLFIDILDAGVRVLLYNGQFDYMDGVAGTEKWLETLEWSGKEEFAKSTRLQWMINNTVAGYVRTYENLSFLVVNDAGHYVPNSVPENALDLIGRFVSDTPFALDPLNSFSNELCSFFSNCGNDLAVPQGECDNGRCVCYNGYTGFDCSYIVTQLLIQENTNDTIWMTLNETLPPLTWIFYEFDISSSAPLTNLSFWLRTENFTQSVLSVRLSYNEVPTKDSFLYISKTHPLNPSPLLGVSLVPGTWYLGIFNEEGTTTSFSITIYSDQTFAYSEEQQKSKLSWAVGILSFSTFFVILLLFSFVTYNMWKSTKRKKTLHATTWQNEL